MATHLEALLQGQAANYILPFLWQRGEDEATIRVEMARVDGAGIGVFFILSPHQRVAVNGTKII